MTTTTTKTTARIMATDEKTGKRYVKTQTVEGAIVTVTKYAGQLSGDTWSWTSALYDVTSPAGELFAGAIKWNGKNLTVGGRPAATLTKAVRAVLGVEPLPAPKAKTKAKAAPKAADVSGGSVIEKDPETGLPRIRPEVQAKADAIVADQAARNAG